MTDPISATRPVSQPGSSRPRWRRCAGLHLRPRLRPVPAAHTDVRDSRIDIKLAAVDPVVRIARWAALSCGSDALTTADRIAAAAGTRYLDADDARALAKCHAIGSSIRWRVRAARWPAAGGDSAGFPERVELSELSPQDRTALRSIGRELTGSGANSTTWRRPRRFRRGDRARRG